MWSIITNTDGECTRDDDDLWHDDAIHLNGGVSIVDESETIWQRIVDDPKFAREIIWGWRTPHGHVRPRMLWRAYKMCEGGNNGSNKTGLE